MNKVFTGFTLILLLVTPVFAQTLNGMDREMTGAVVDHPTIETLPAPIVTQTLKVTTGVITSGVIDRAPIDEIVVFNTSIPTLYCFTRIEGAEEETIVSHTWKLDNVEVSRSELSVRSNYWRTWSSKGISPEAIGDWQVEIRDAEEQLLKTIHFTLN